MSWAIFTFGALATKSSANIFLARMILGDWVCRGLGDVHKIIRIPEETGGIHKKVGVSKCAMAIAECGIVN